MTSQPRNQNNVLLIRNVVAEAERLQTDPEGFSGLLTDGVVLINAVGRRIFGRDQVRAAMREAMKTSLANVLTRYEIVDVRFVRPDVAVVSGIKHVSEEGSGRAKGGAKITLTFVLTREQRSWLIAVVHNTLVPD
jgi:uncharacterized protein (TIGR02246 family)